MIELDKVIKDLREQNKILLESMEKHINEKSCMRKELYKYSNPPSLSFKEDK